MSRLLTVHTGRSFTVSIRVKNKDGSPVDMTGRELVFLAESKRTRTLRGNFSASGDVFSAAFSAVDTGKLAAGQAGSWEIVTYPSLNASSAVTLASGTYEVKSAAALS